MHLLEAVCEETLRATQAAAFLLKPTHLCLDCVASRVGNSGSDGGQVLMAMCKSTRISTVTMAFIKVRAKDGDLCVS